MSELINKDAQILKRFYQEAAEELAKENTALRAQLAELTKERDESRAIVRDINEHTPIALAVSIARLKLEQKT